ncbi:MAG: polysaccharide deacetylase family protein [Firmicutes bacterium]|nr:polysaccharide deacetylase family protein [Bacillota bacterium]
MKKSMIPLAAVVLVAVIICSVVFAFPLSGLPSGAPTMFINDEPWYNETMFGWIKESGECYVPVSCLSVIKGVSVMNYLEYNSMLISYKDKFISINTLSCEDAYSENTGSFKFHTFFKKAENGLSVLYIPAQKTCALLGLYFEMDQTRSAIRIYDDRAVKLMEDLLWEHNPALVETTTESETETETEEPATTPPVTDNPETTVINRAECVCIAFDGALNEYTAEILDILDKYKVKAAFFISGNDTVQHRETVRRIFLSGHFVGLFSESDDGEKYAEDINIFFDELDYENNVIYRLIKTKFRLAKTPESLKTKKNLLDDNVLAAALARGYFLCDFTCEPATFNAAVTELQKSQYPVMGFKSSKKTVAVLPDVLEYIEKNAIMLSADILLPATQK